MAMHEIKISQLGEGLTQVKVVALLKNVGDLVDKDEPLLEIETDKAVMEIESPRAGILVRWLVDAGQLVAVGAGVAVVDEREASVNEVAVVDERVAVVDEREVVVDESVAVVDEREVVVNESVAVVDEREVVVDESVAVVDERENRVVDEIPLVSDSEISGDSASISARCAVRNRLMSPREKARLQHQTASSTTSWPLSPRQTRLTRLMSDSAAFVDEAWLSMPVWWDEVSDTARRFRGLSGLDYRPSVLELLAWSATQAQKSHPKFRLLNVGARGYEVCDEPLLGISVALPDDELAVASVSASLDDFATFVRALRDQVSAVQHHRAAPGRCSLVISNLSAQGVQFAAPRVVMPSVATLFVGAPFDVPAKGANGAVQWRRQAQLVLSFDHRVINGAGAAAFLKAVVVHAQSCAPNAAS